MAGFPGVVRFRSWTRFGLEGLVTLLRRAIVGEGEGGCRSLDCLGFGLEREKGDRLEIRHLCKRTRERSGREQTTAAAGAKSSSAVLFANCS
jgi:hypothetical protein